MKALIPPIWEASLRKRLRENDRAAFESVVRSHYATVYRQLYFLTNHDESQVEDLTQETFMRVFSRIGGLRNTAALREFVLTVAVNVLKQELRRRWVRRRVLLSDSGSVPEIEAPSADPEAREALARCYAILDKLGARERAAFVLRYMEEQTLEQVASGLGVSLSTAKRLVNRATERVSKHVGTDEGLRNYFDQGQNAADPPRVRPDTNEHTSTKANVSR